MFGLTRNSPLESKDLIRMGRLEADVETLKLQWASYRDELRKLVNRLEKRDERADKKAAAALANENPIDKDATPEERMDDVTTRVLARRNRHGVSG